MARHVHDMAGSRGHGRDFMGAFERALGLAAGLDEMDIIVVYADVVRV